MVVLLLDSTCFLDSWALALPIRALVRASSDYVNLPPSEAATETLAVLAM